jgi:hypothetical protein
MLQPLHIIISQPFKACIQSSYSEWAQKIHEMMHVGHLKKAALTEMCWWILEAWPSISQNMVVKRFKVAGISNKMGESEDDFLWHWSNEEKSQEDTADSELTYFD